MFVIQQKLENSVKNRVELHVHLDGSARHETIWELSRKKGLPLPGDGSIEALKKEVSIQEPKDLCHFLKGFRIILPPFQGDLEAIERLAYEFAEDKAKEHVRYCEVRFAPHFFLPPQNTNSDQQNGNVENTNGTDKVMTAEDVIKSVLKGLQKGEDLGIKINLILCCIRGITVWDWELLDLCEKYKGKGIVGIDLAGDEAAGCSDGQEIYDPIEIEVFKAAKEKGIHRTVHAGEAAGADSVKFAIEQLHAERIGHGYRCIENEETVELCKNKRIHFEICPHSSYYTGAIASLKTQSKRHPILAYTENDLSYGINTDDPTITLTTLEDEYQLVSSWGLNEAHLTKANFEAAKHAFLEYDEKVELINDLKKAYGIDDLEIPQPNNSTINKKDKILESKPSIIVEAWADRS